MQNEYYGAATTPTDDYLAHYGVKGMKWGVRKAIEKGNTKKLDRLYQKALRKAKKLNTNANASKSMQEYKGRMSDAGALGITGAVVGGMPLGMRALARSQNKRIYGMAGLIPFDSETTPHVTTPMGLGMLGASAYQVARGIAAKRRTTQKGHAIAKAKAQDWRKEMKSAFKGTKYSNLPGADKQNKAYAYTPMNSQFKDAARDSVTYPGYSMNKRIANGSSANYKKKKRR